MKCTVPIYVEFSFSLYYIFEIMQTKSLRATGVNCNCYFRIFPICTCWQENMFYNRYKTVRTINIMSFVFKRPFMQYYTLPFIDNPNPKQIIMLFVYFLSLYFWFNHFYLCMWNMVGGSQRRKDLEGESNISFKVAILAISYL